METPAEELEVVRDDEEAAHRDERQQPEIAPNGNEDAERGGAADRTDGEGDEHPRRDPRPQRTPGQLVQRVRADAHREEERDEGQTHDAGVEMRGDRGADRDVREMPQRVRRVQQRDVVAPAAALQRVERRPYLLRPHVTSPPPTLSDLAST